jgi:hypothetical protein
MEFQPVPFRPRIGKGWCIAAPYWLGILSSSRKKSFISDPSDPSGAFWPFLTLPRRFFRPRRAGQGRDHTLGKKLLGEALRFVVKRLRAFGLALLGKPGCKLFWQSVQSAFRHILEDHSGVSSVARQRKNQILGQLAVRPFSTADGGGRCGPRSLRYQVSPSATDTSTPVLAWRAALIFRAGIEYQTRKLIPDTCFGKHQVSRQKSDTGGSQVSNRGNDT